MLDESKLFPIPIKMIGNSMIVSYSAFEIPYGTKILTINGECIDSLLHSFTSKYKDTFEKRLLEKQFSLIYLIKKGNREKFDIKYASYSEESMQLEKSISGIDFQTWIRESNNPVFPLDFAKQSRLINTHFYQEANTYYLQLNSFKQKKTAQQHSFDFLTSEHKKFDKAFSIIFKEMAAHQAKNLIIDLRYNPGGNIKVPSILYSYIAKESYREDITIRIQDFEIPHAELIKRINSKTIDNKGEVAKFIRSYERKFVKNSDSGYSWKFAKNKEVKPSKRAFQGNVFLLVGGRSTSASSYFAALFKNGQRGIIVGEEMGGSFRSLTAGHQFVYQLPHSKIELAVPIMEVNFSDELSKNITTDKIKPDWEFSEEEQWKYFVEKKDIEVEKILEHVQNNGK